MKKTITALLLFLFCANYALAISDSDYEKRLEYRRKKIEIMVKTNTVGETSAYTDFNAWSSTISPEAGYSYNYTSGQSRSGVSSTVKEVSNWVIIRGGVRELSDTEFLSIVGDTDDAARVQATVDERDKWAMIGNVTGVIGICIAVAGSAAGETSTITAGAVVSILGFVLSSFNYQPKHYIAADYALELTDNYNIKLKKDLGLPIDFE